MLSLFLLVPLATVLLLNLPFFTVPRKLVLGICCLLSLAQAVVAPALPGLLAAFPGDPIAALLHGTFAVDAVSIVVLLSIGIIAFMALLIAETALKEEKDFPIFANLLLVSLVGMNGMVLVTDLFTLYIFLEITSLSSFILIGFKKTEESLEGAFKYLLLSAVASIMILTAIALLMLLAGGTSFAAVRTAFDANASSGLARVCLGLLAAGFCVKSGLIPFHGWVPDAYSSAPSPTSVLLAGIVTKTGGMYVLIRLVISVFGFRWPLQPILIGVGLLSMIPGAFAALGQRDMKRLLAWSSISQMGYIILGLACGSPLGLAGALFHLFNHAVFKSLLFTNAAAVEEKTGTRDIRLLGGLAEQMPVTGTTSVIGLLSASGVPPFAGFWSKLLIIIALWQSGWQPVAVAAVLTSIVTLGYLLSLQRSVFFGKRRDESALVTEAGPGITVPSVLLAVLAVTAGLFLPYLLSLLGITGWLP